MINTPILASILKGKGAIIELIIGAVFLGLGVNLLATAVASFFDKSPILLATTSLSLIVLSIFFIARRILSTFNATQEFEGFFCCHRETNKLINIPEYEYSEDLFRNFKSLFSENEAYKKAWHSDPISKTHTFDKASGRHIKRVPTSAQLIIEATEYFVLDKLSTHLADYFNDDTIDKNLLQEITREDVPSLVFKNRFLDTFSRPMQDRAAFVDSGFDDRSSIGEVVLSFGAGGVQYQKFDLTLPAGAKVSRISSSSIEISTPRFNLQITVTLPGYNTNLPANFESLYMEGIKNREASTYKIHITANIRFKPISLISRKGWQYHSWLDSFISSLEEDFSKEYFFKKIDWDRSATIARLVKRSSLPLNSKLYVKDEEQK